MYQALYRKWRPRTFDQVVGQEHITSILKAQVAHERLSHAYLFTGTRGTGKTTCAKILARAANCQSPQNGNPCNECPSCVGIKSGAILDVMEFDAASNSRVDDIRQVLEETVYTPAFGKKRVYIIDEVHMLSTSAFNALLKTLEEPPAHLMFILATTEQHKVPATILSRCQRFAFRRIQPEILKARILEVARAEGIDLTDSGAALICRVADGSLRDALSLLDQCAGLGGRTLDETAVAEATGLLSASDSASLLEAVLAGDTARALELFNSLYMSGKETAGIMDELLLLCRDLLVVKKAPKSAVLLSAQAISDRIARIAAQADDRRIGRMIEGLQGARKGLQASATRRIDGELCMAMLCQDRTRQDIQPCPPAAEAAPAPVAQTPPAAQKPQTVVEQRQAKSDASPDRQPAPPAGTPLAGESQGAPGDFSAILKQVEPKLSIGEYLTLSNPAFVKPRFSPDVLYVEVDSEFTLLNLNKPPILQALAVAAGRRVEIKLADQKTAAKKTDNFDQLIEFGKNNPDIVKIN